MNEEALRSGLRVEANPRRGSQDAAAPFPLACASNEEWSVTVDWRR
jgi:hypothetical protein